MRTKEECEIAEELVKIEKKVVHDLIEKLHVMKIFLIPFPVQSADHWLETNTAAQLAFAIKHGRKMPGLYDSSVLTNAAYRAEMKDEIQKRWDLVNG